MQDAGVLFPAFFPPSVNCQARVIWAEVPPTLIDKIPPARQVCGRTQLAVGNATPVGEALGCVRKQAEQAARASE